MELRRQLSPPGSRFERREARPLECKRYESYKLIAIRFFSKTPSEFAAVFLRISRRASQRDSRRLHSLNQLSLQHVLLYAISIHGDVVCDRRDFDTQLSFIADSTAVQNLNLGSG